LIEFADNIFSVHTSQITNLIK